MCSMSRRLIRSDHKSFPNHALLPKNEDKDNITYVSPDDIEFQNSVIALAESPRPTAVGCLTEHKI